MTNTTQKTTLMAIFNAHVDFQINEYIHPGRHMLNGKLIEEIVDDVVKHLQEGTLDTSDLHIRIDYHRPDTKGGNQKLKGIIYMASHPLIDCFLDGLLRERPSCTGLRSWCYVFSNVFYKSYGKQLSMLRNSILYLLEPERAEKEICEWIEKNKHKFVRDRHNHIGFRIDEAGDLTNCLPIWLHIAEKYKDINFYAYTKQFKLLEDLPYCIHDVYDNFRILLSDSTNDDPNPISQSLRERYSVFGIDFADASKNPDWINELRGNKEEYKKHICPGAKAGCFKCTKCSEKVTPATKDIIAEEH